MSTKVQCYNLAQKGKTVKEIASQLNLKEYTVRQNIKQVIEIHNNAWSTKDERKLKREFKALASRLNKTPSVVMRKLKEIEAKAILRAKHNK